MTGSMDSDEMSHEEVMGLLGAYALDAVEPEEARAIEQHLASCPRCSAEVVEHHGVAALLANSGGDAPADVWERIAARIEASAPVRPTTLEAPKLVRPFDPESRASPRRQVAASIRRARIRLVIAGVAAAAAVATITVLAIQVTHLDHRVGQLQAASQSQSQGLVQAAQAALNDPMARRVTLDAAHNSRSAVAEIVILPSGTAFVLNSQLPVLPPNETYQLWGELGDELVSLGLLGNHPMDVAFRIDPSAPVESFAITAEHAGGVVRSTHVPVAMSAPVRT